jgi:hypothetical protein
VESKFRGGIMVWIVKAELKDNYKVFIEFNDDINGIVGYIMLG